MDYVEKSSFAGRVLRDMTSSVLVLDRKGYIVYVNKPASGIFEISEDLEPGTTKFDLEIKHQENDEFSTLVLDSLFDRENTHTGKVKYVSPSGKKYTLRVSSSFLELEDNDMENLVVITISDETKEEILLKKFHDSSTTFSTFLFGFSLWMIFYALWLFLKEPFPSTFLTHGIEFLSIGMLFFILLKTDLTWKDLGILSNNTKKDVIVGIIVAACAFGFLCLLKVVARMVRPGSFEPELPFFDITKFGVNQLIYILTAGVQEFLARCVMQSNLHRIMMVNRHSVATSIILSSMIFAALHIHFGFLFMVGAAILAGLEGILYYKQQSIVGVWIVHWVFGVSGTLLSLIDH